MKIIVKQVLTPLPEKQGLKQTMTKRLPEIFQKVLTPLPEKQGLKLTPFVPTITYSSGINATSRKTRIETR